MTSKTKNFHFLGTIFTRTFIFLLGLMMVLSALHKLYIYCNYRYLGSMAYGIIDHPSSGRDFGGRPLIEYTGLDGRVHEFKSRAKTHLFYTPKRGEKIKILIHKSDPQKVIVDNLFHYVLLPLIFLCAGIYSCSFAVAGRNSSSLRNKITTVG